jgi:beta-lactamase regulating signal transducer with metallopeptidase domain
MFQWLIVHTVTTAALAVVVLTASRCFRLGAAARHLLWLIVVVKFLTPPVVYWPWTLAMYGPAPATTARAAPPIGDVRTIIIDMPPDSGTEPEVIDSPLASVAAPTVEKRAAVPFSWDWLPATAGWTWLAGGVLVALWQTARILRWRLRLMQGALPPDGLETSVRELAGAMGLRPPRLIVLRRVASPMVWCFGVPRLLWPSGLEARLSAEGCRAVLLHELAHLRRRDHWVGWLVLTGGCVWWWHPLFWWVRRRLGQEAELACDAWVVGAAPAARRAYAEAILEVSQRMSAAVAVPALAAAGGRRDLERRLVMIMRGPASRRLSWVGLAGAIALGLLALPAWSLGGDKTPLPTVSTPPPMRVTEAPPAGPTAADPLLLPDAAPRTPPVPSQPAAPGVNASKNPALLERDRKLKELEDKVQQLLKEMQQLRGQAPIVAMPQPKGSKQTTQPAITPQEGLFGFLTASAPVQVTRAPDPPPVRVAPTAAYQPIPAVRAESSTEVITLTRVTYKLKAATAEALASFLKENVKTAILEIKNEGDNLVVTTTPDAQHVIGQLIDLIQGKKPAFTMIYGPPGTTPTPAAQGGPPGGDSALPWPKYIGPPVAK